MENAQLNYRLLDMQVASIKALIRAIETRDNHVEGHSLQVAKLAVKIARAMGMNEWEISMIEFAGLLHDAGKIMVPDHILKKTSALDQYDWIMIKKHTIYSAQIIEPILNLREIRGWVLYHHERWDGAGYPEGIRGDLIPLPARILSVCDTFAAMTSDRPYRKALDREFALNELKQVAGVQLDPDIVSVFVGFAQFSMAEHIRGE